MQTTSATRGGLVVGTLSLLVYTTDSTFGYGRQKRGKRRRGGGGGERKDALYQHSKGHIQDFRKLLCGNICIHTKGATTHLPAMGNVLSPYSTADWVRVG